MVKPWSDTNLVTHIHGPVNDYENYDLFANKQSLV